MSVFQGLWFALPEPFWASPVNGESFKFTGETHKFTGGTYKFTWRLHQYNMALFLCSGESRMDNGGLHMVNGE